MNHCRILIVGAGLAGLSLARALRQAGLAPQVIEREAGRGVAGTGIYLPANGVRALRTLGLEGAVAARGTGGGVPYTAYGQQMRRGIAALNRPMFLHELASTWLPAVPEIDHRLRSAPPARVLDMGCGLGASSMALARAYPSARVLGVDLDQASVTEARAQAAQAGVADRVTFMVGDAAQVTPDAPFDLITIFEALHDMGDPEGALRAARALLADDGNVLVADERVADTFTAPGDPTERFMYGWSILHCLPATLADIPWRRPARSCAPPPWPAGPLRWASPGSRSWPSTTPSGASTACTAETTSHDRGEEQPWNTPRSTGSNWRMR